MTGKVSQCGMCGQYFNSRIELKSHIDQNHRITEDSYNGITTND